MVLAGIFFLETEVEEDVLTACDGSAETQPLQEAVYQCEDGTCYVLSVDGKGENAKLPRGNDGENDAHSLT